MLRRTRRRRKRASALGPTARFQLPCLAGRERVNSAQLLGIQGGGGFACLGEDKRGGSEDRSREQAPVTKAPAWPHLLGPARRGGPGTAVRV